MDNQKRQSLQDLFLNALRKEHVPVSIYLVNGIKLLRTVEAFDPYVVMLKTAQPRWSTSTLFPQSFRSVLSDTRRRRPNKVGPNHNPEGNSKEPSRCADTVYGG